MGNADRSSALGPAMFFGLCIYALATAKPAPESPDPARAMDLRATPAPIEAVLAGAPPARPLNTIRPPRIGLAAPAPVAATDRRLPPQAPPRRLAVFVPGRSGTPGAPPGAAPGRPAAPPDAVPTVAAPRSIAAAYSRYAANRHRRCPAWLGGAHRLR